MNKSDICIYNPINAGYYIYDIYHNDNNNLIIISPLETKPLTIKYNDIDFNLHICSHKHTYVYVSKDKTEYEKKIKLNINNKYLEVNVNKYPNFKDEIIMSTMVYNEDNYIRQWIEFNLNIGIKHFIIYDNSKYKGKDNSYKSIEKSSNLEKVLSDYINQGTVVLINWPYPKRKGKSGISGQTTQQNHSIWAFKNCKYIGLFDIDEYINMKNDTNIYTFFDNLIKQKKINVSKIGSFRLLNKFFHNPNNKSTSNYDFFNIYNCDKITLLGHEKNFVIPKNVNTFSVHQITNGKIPYIIPHQNAYFNHYYFLNKKTRGKKKTNLTDDSINKHLNFL